MFFFSPRMEAELILMEMLLEAVPPISDWALSDASEEEESQHRDSEPESGSAASSEDDSRPPEPEPDSTSRSESRSCDGEESNADEYNSANADEYNSDEAWGIVPQPYPEAAYPAPYRAVYDGVEWWPVVARREIIWRPLEDQVALGPTWFLRRGTDPQAEEESKTVNHSVNE